MNGRKSFSIIARSFARPVTNMTSDQRTGLHRIQPSVSATGEAETNCTNDDIYIILSLLECD
jgi:hypothetical protein